MDEETAILTQWLELHVRETTLKGRVKDAEAELDQKAYTHYPKLTATEVQALVVDDKWLASLGSQIHGELDRISQDLTGRIQELSERYASPLPMLTKESCSLKQGGVPSGIDGA